MKAETLKDLAYYEALPYTIVLRRDDEGDFVARIPELPGCTAHGDSEAGAVENLRSIQRLWIEEALSSGQQIPEPEEQAELPSGKWVQRVPRRLHKDLTDLARRESVSLNQLVTSMLAQALTVRTCSSALETIIMDARTHLEAAPIHLLWIDHRRDENLWSTKSREGSLLTKLARVKNLKVKESYYPHELTEGNRQLTR